MLREISGLFRVASGPVHSLVKSQWSVYRRGLSSAVQILERSEEATPSRSVPSKTVERLDLKYPDLLPDPNPEWRNHLREKLERCDMMRRRKVLNVPQFYVGSIVAVTSSNSHAPTATVRFLGICIQRSGYALRSKFILRNVINNEGVEVEFALYSPTIQKIEVIRLEKRLDSELFYLRDAPLEYSTFPMDMEISYRTHEEVPVNTLKVPLNPRPWLQRYERMNLQGVILPPLSQKIMEKAKMHEKPWLRYDLMDRYRKSIPEEEQREIFEGIEDELKQLEEKIKFTKKRKEFSKPKKQTLF